MKIKRHIQIRTTFLNLLSTKTLNTSKKQLDMSTNQCNTRNWKERTKRLYDRIKINNLQMHIILRANKILQAHLKINKRHRIVMFLYMNLVKQFCTSTFKRTFSAQETTISQIKEMLESFNYDPKQYVQQTDTFKLILIVVTRNKKDVQSIHNMVLYISIKLRTLPSIVIV